jgi:hypothetical protein
MSSALVDGRAIGSPSGRQLISVSARVLEELRRRHGEDTPDYDSTIARLLWPPRTGPRATVKIEPVQPSEPELPVGRHGCASTKKIDGELRLCRAAPGELHVWWSRSHKRVTWK